MKHISKVLFVALVAMIGISFVGKASAANLSTNLTWCSTNSGSIGITLSECNGLARLYHETSGDNWVSTGNWFSNTNLSTWVHPSAFITDPAILIGGGHIKVLNLNAARLSGAIATGLQLLPYLTGFSAYTNGITSINFSQSSGLLSLDIANNTFTGINLTLLTGLVHLNVGSHGMNSLNLSQNINLRTLYVTYTDLTWIDLSHNTLLTGVGFGLNLFTGLDFRNNPLLEEIQASYNMTPTIQTVNVSGLIYLHTLYLDYAGVRNIDLSTNTGLVRFAANNSNLTGINFSGLTRLEMVGLFGNAIPSVDISTNRNLIYFYIGGQTGGVFTGIDISHNTGLEILDTTNNPLATLIVASNGAYSGGLVAYLSGNVLNENSLDLNTLWFLHDHYAGWGYRGIPAGGTPIVVPKDNCPQGDTSPTFYDSLCSGMSPSNGGVSAGGGGGGGNASSSTPAVVTPVITPAVVPAITPTVTNTSLVVTPKTSFDVYRWAYENHITTLPITKARLNDGILRYEAAKMIAHFAVNVEKKSITKNSQCTIENFADYSTFDAEMKDVIHTICDLGLMGWKGNKNGLLDAFRPFDTLSAEEFGIVIGRYLGQSSSQPDSSKRIDIMRFLQTVMTSKS